MAVSVTMCPGCALIFCSAVTAELRHWRSVRAVGHSQNDGPARADLEGTVLPDDYLTAADEMLSQAHRTQSAGDPSAAYRVEAQVKALEAVAAAIDRLAVAVEALSPPAPPRFRPGGPPRGSH